MSLFRIVQEILNNVLSIRRGLGPNLGHARGRALEIAVQDNGEDLTWRRCHPACPVDPASD